MPVAVLVGVGGECVVSGSETDLQVFDGPLQRGKQERIFSGLHLLSVESVNSDQREPYSLNKYIMEHPI